MTEETPFKDGHVASISIRHTWGWAMEIYIACLEDGTETGKANARAELRRLAKLVDEMNEGSDGATA